MKNAQNDKWRNTLLVFVTHDEKFQGDEIILLLLFDTIVLKLFVRCCNSFEVVDEICVFFVVFCSDRGCEWLQIVQSKGLKQDFFALLSSEFHKERNITKQYTWGQLGGRL